MTKSTITHCFIDADPPVYKSSSSKEKMRYHWERGSEKSEVFNNAKDADDFIVSQELMDDADGWVRVGTKDVPELKEVLEATDTVRNDYMNTAKKLTGNPDLIFKGLLTGSGRKSKDIEGLEQMYQWDRNPASKPFYLQEARDYLITTNSWVKMAKKGFEADAPLLAMAEAKGEKAVVLFIDKDIRAVEGCWYIDMNLPLAERELVFSPKGVGKLWINDKNKVKGHGWIWDWVLAIGGDTADNYKGLKGMGDKGVYKLLKDCTTKLEVVEKVIELYEKKYPEGVTYTPEKYPEDRPQREQTRTARELLEQHFNLAYQERKPYKLWSLEKFLEEEGVSEVCNND